MLVLIAVSRSMRRRAGNPELGCHVSINFAVRDEVWFSLHSEVVLKRVRPRSTYMRSTTHIKVPLGNWKRMRYCKPIAMHLKVCRSTTTVQPKRLLRPFTYAYYAGNKSALRQVDRMNICHSEDVRSQLHQEDLVASSCGVSSWTVGGNLSLTDDWDIARCGLMWLWSQSRNTNVSGTLRRVSRSYSPLRSCYHEQPGRSCQSHSKDCT